MARALALLMTAAGLLLPTHQALAQSKLPPCPGSIVAYWNNCFGPATYPNGGKYVGEWRDNRANGQGTFTAADGRKYVGEFRDHKRNGRGTLTFADGSQQVGYWNDGHYLGTAAPPNYQVASPPPPQVADPLVASIQALLSALGFEPGMSDGVRGPKTEKAISLFQTAIGDKVDGRPSEALLAKLQKAVAERSVSPPPKAAPHAPEPRKRQAEVISSGTGFFIGRDVIVTNQHVVDGCTELRTRRSGADIGSARVVAANKSDDLAALKSEKPSDVFLELRIGSPPLKPAESILVFGYPLSGALSSTGNTTLGNITALTGLRDDSRFIQISAAVQLGNSGGPVLDEAGRLVGVVQGKLDAIKIARAVGDIPQNVNFAIRSSTLSNFLEANQIPYEVAAKAEVQPSIKVAERASAASVQIHCLK